MMKVPVGEQNIGTCLSVGLQNRIRRPLIMYACLGTVSFSLIPTPIPALTGEGRD
jgi:hypothetical protein